MPNAILTAVTAMALLAQPLAAGASGERDQDRARAALQAGEILPLSTILDRVAREQPGQVLAVELERDASGWFTGAIRGVPSMREGKVLRMEQWLLARGLHWSTVHSTFYSDSMNDLPLLECVNAPVATNPDARLRALATQRGWRILDLFPQG